MADAARALVTEAEFLALPESNLPIELLDGEVVVSPSPTYWHQEILGRLVASLRAWASGRADEVTVVQAPLDVRFGPARILQPDAAVFATRLAPDVETPIDEVPVLCVEVLSTNRAYDRVAKRYVYAEAGVREYWLVDPAGHVERRSGPGLAQSEAVAGRLTTPLLPDFALDVAALLAPHPPTAT